MISETQSVEVPTVEKKKRNYKKKETKAVEAPVAKPKAKPTRAKKQEMLPDANAENEYNKFVKLIETNPSIAEEFQTIIKKHLK